MYQDDDDFRAFAYEGGDEKKGKYDDHVKGFKVREELKDSGGYASYRQRGCTDVLFLLVFWIGMGFMLFLGADGLMKGNPAKLLAPLDGDDKFCGVDKGYEAYDKLFIPLADASLTSLMPGSVCVKECPQKDTETVCMKTKKHEQKCPVAQYAAADTLGVGYCLPTDLNELPADATAGLNRIKAAFMQSGNAQYIIDITKAYKSVAICSLLSFVLCLAYLKLMSAFAEPIAWLCVVLIQIGLFALAVASWYGKQYLTDKYKEIDGPTETQTKDYDQRMILCWVAIGFFALLGVIFLCAVICGFSHLKLAIDVIDASADFLDETKRVYFVPFYFFLCSFVSILVWTVCVIGVYSQGEIVPDPYVPQAKVVTLSRIKHYQLLYLLFAILWLTAWFEYANSFVVMHSAVQYYFSWHKNERGNLEHVGDVEVAESLRCAYFKHPGSIAVGAFIIALVRFIRIIFVYVCRQLEKGSGGNPVFKLVSRCADCYLWCLEKICDYINAAAFAYMAVSGESFCSSAWNGFLLNLKHLVKFTFANTLARMFVALGKVAIVLANMSLAYQVMEYTGSIDRVSSVWGPLICVGLVTFAAASIFLGLFDDTVMGMMTSLAIDMDMHGGDHCYGPETFHSALGKVSFRCGGYDGSDLKKQPDKKVEEEAET